VERDPIDYRQKRALRLRPNRDANSSSSAELEKAGPTPAAVPGESRADERRCRGETHEDVPDLPRAEAIR
jgi:hypothetical protein